MQQIEKRMLMVINPSECEQKQRRIVNNDGHLKWHKYNRNRENEKHLGLLEFIFLQVSEGIILGSGQKFRYTFRKRQREKKTHKGKK